MAAPKTIFGYEVRYQSFAKLFNNSFYLLDIRQKLAKKDFDQVSKQKIKDTLRNWLNLKTI